MDPGELFSQIRSRCGGISENCPHAAKYRIADLKGNSAVVAMRLVENGPCPSFNPESMSRSVTTPGIELLSQQKIIRQFLKK